MSSFWLFLGPVHNQLQVYINGALWYDTGIIADSSTINGWKIPIPNEYINPGSNSLEFKGFNSHNSNPPDAAKPKAWSFSFYVMKYSPAGVGTHVFPPQSPSGVSNPDMWVYDATFTLIQDTLSTLADQ